MKPVEYLKKEESKSLEQLKELLRIPSVSAQPSYKNDMQQCAAWVKGYLDNLGIKTELCETKGHPIVYGEYIKSSTLPTVLIYGHYDVQPPEPLELWKTPPFTPSESDGYLVARGASDDKGQFFAQIKGVEALLKTQNELPVNIKFVIEGEEEAGVTNLVPFIKNNKNKLKAHIAVISDSSQYGPDMPAINYGLRGIAFVEVKIYGPEKDLHSGSFGGAVANPINILCQMIGTLHDADRRVLVDGFYENVYTASVQERNMLAQLPFQEQQYLATTGSQSLSGEKGYTTLERTWIRPTLDCNGITGGYQGEGSKTIIPSWASAKITMRLVPDMTPQEICDKLEKHLKKICPGSVRMEITKHGGAFPVQVPFNSSWCEAAAKAIETGFGRRPYFTKEGGSIPIVETFKTELGIDTLLIGFGQNDNNTHSPNERFLIKDFHRGCQTALALIEELAKVPIR